MDADHVGRPQQRRQVGDQLDAERGRAGSIQVGIEADYTHVEGGAGHLRQTRPDPTAADDAEGPAGKLDAAQCVPRAIISAPEQAVARHNLFGEGDHEAEGVLRDRLAIGFGRIHHRDTARGGRRYVHVVIPDAVAADDPQPGAAAIISAVSRVARSTITVASASRGCTVSWLGSGATTTVPAALKSATPRSWIGSMTRTLGRSDTSGHLVYVWAADSAPAPDSRVRGNDG